MQRAAEDHPSRELLLDAVGLSMEFPGVRALDDVDFAIRRGEIVALLGQNGAGKSTLIQILAGAHPAGGYAGSVDFAGKPHQPRSVADAEAAGIALVPQEINVVPDLTVGENITLNAEPTRFGLIDVARAKRIAMDALDAFGLETDPGASMSSLDLAGQQLVVIARALAKRAQLLILDEPTAALTESESAQLFERLRSLKRAGVAIIFVSHRLAEVFAIADRIVVLRDGRVRGRHRTADVSRQDVIAEMVGELAALPERSSSVSGEPVMLEVRDLGVVDPDGRVRVSDLDLVVRRGEVVGLFGLLGAGCIEAALAIYGAHAGRRAGRILVDGVDAAIRTPVDAVALALGLMAQDRRDCLVADQSIESNVTMASLEKVAPHGLLDLAAARRRALDRFEQLRIKAQSLDVEVGMLSGGNQQKVQIARWLAADTRVLVLIDPTRGVDVGARHAIKQIWSDLAANGRAILLASTDVEELVDVCDRVVVMRHGRPVGELAGAELSERALMRLATDG